MSRVQKIQLVVAIISFFIGGLGFGFSAGIEHVDCSRQEEQFDRCVEQAHICMGVANEAMRRLERCDAKHPGCWKD